MKPMLLNTVPSLFGEFDRLFDSTISADYFMDEDQNGYHLSLDLPGVKKEDLKVEIKGNTLVIEAQSKGKKSRKYHRVFRIPNTVETDNIEADLKDGVLLLTMSKIQEKSRLIQIK